MCSITGPQLKRVARRRDKHCVKPAALTLCTLLVALAAAAEPRVYELSLPAVQCSYSSEKAEQAARTVDPSLYAEADPRSHKLVVRFEDESTSIEAITAALGSRGYQVARQQQLR